MPIPESDRRQLSFVRGFGYAVTGILVAALLAGVAFALVNDDVPLALVFVGTAAFLIPTYMWSSVPSPATCSPTSAHWPGCAAEIGARTWLVASVGSRDMGDNVGWNMAGVGADFIGFIQPVAQLAGKALGATKFVEPANRTISPRT